MGRTPSWEVSQKIPQTLRNQKVYYLIHKSSPLVPILSQINPVHNFTTDLRSNLTLCSRLRRVFQLVSFPQVYHQNPVCSSPLPHAWRMPRPSHYSGSGHPNTTDLVRTADHEGLQCATSSTSPVILSLLGPSTFYTYEYALGKMQTIITF